MDVNANGFVSIHRKLKKSAIINRRSAEHFLSTKKAHMQQFPYSLKATKRCKWLDLQILNPS